MIPENLCSLDKTLEKVLDACRFVEVRKEFENLCRTSVVYKNDRARNRHEGSLSDRVFQKTEQALEDEIMKIVCSKDGDGGVLADMLYRLTNINCQIVPESCFRFLDERKQ